MKTPKSRPKGVKSMMDITDPSITQSAELAIVSRQMDEIPPIVPPVAAAAVTPPPAHIEDDFSLDDPKPPVKPVVPEVKPDAPVPAKGKDVNMRELARLREEAETKAAKIEADFEAFKKDHATKVTELETIVEKTSFERSKKFQTNFQKPIEEAEAALTGFLTEAGAAPEVAGQILSLSGKDRIEFLDAQFGNGVAGAEALRLASAVSQRQAARAQAIENYKTEQVKFNQEDVEQHTKDEAEIERNFAFVLNKLAPKVSLLREVEGNAEHNALVADRIKTARAIMSGTATENDMLMAPFLAVTARDYMRQNAELRAQLDQYKRRLGEDVSSSSGVRHGAAPDNEPRPKGGRPQGAIATFAQMRS